jgi:hypothetical protein
MLRRLSLALGLAVLLAAVAVVLSYLAARICLPVILPGDEAWTRAFLLDQAFRALVTGTAPPCYTGATAAPAQATVARVLLIAAPALALAALAWEGVGWSLRRRWLAWRGGHSILALAPGNASWCQSFRGLLLAPDREAAVRLAPYHPWNRVEAGPDPAALAGRLGLRRAARIVAASDNDLWNLRLAEAALDAGSAAEITARIEHPDLRAIAAERLFPMADRTRAQVTLLAMDGLRQRIGLQLAMPGRFTDLNAQRRHIALCGGGAGFDQLLVLLARQGYGLQDRPPLLTVLHLGDPTAALRLDQLVPAEAAEVRLHHIGSGDREALDEAIALCAGGADRLCAVHLWHMAGAADHLARLWETALDALGLPVPPLVTYGTGRAPGSSGMIRPCPALDLGVAQTVATRLDRRARAAHGAWSAAQRGRRGSDFGTLPSEHDWSALPERLQDDNRAFADHVDHLLAGLGFVAAPAAASAAQPSEAEVQRLAPVEHARWMAARLVAGWRQGTRDDRRRTHPDLVPFDALDVVAQEKDAAMVRLLPALLALNGERALRLVRIDGTAFRSIANAKITARTINALGVARAGLPHPDPDQAVLLRLNDDLPGLQLGQAAQALGVRTELILRPTDQAKDLALRAGVLASAHAIIVANGTDLPPLPGPVIARLDQDGGLHAVP